MTKNLIDAKKISMLLTSRANALVATFGTVSITARTPNLNLKTSPTLQFPI